MENSLLSYSTRETGLKHYMENQWFKQLARLYQPVYQYRSDTIKISYAGYSSIKRNYFVRMLMDNSHIPAYLGRKWFWEIPNLVKSNKNDLVISEISQFALNQFHKFNGYILPVWADMRINIDQPMDEICKKSTTDFSNVIRRIRKYNLSFEIRTDQESFKFFIDKIYLPYITNHHGDEALIDDVNIMWESTFSPFLMAVKEDGMIVGASLIEKMGDSLKLNRIGLLDGNEEYRRHGVIGALYYFGILEGKKMGFRYLNVGGTRPFLTDGLTKYKMGLGAEFVSDFNSKSEYVWLGFNENSISAKEFILSNPFVHVDKDYRLLRHLS